VDVEDWVQSVWDVDRALTHRFVGNTHRVLELFADRGVCGTFFVLGLAAEKAPSLVREIQEAGHEIQSHGYGHRPYHSMSPVEVRADLIRSKKLLEDITGEAVDGFRAPAFSIGERNLWVLDELVECGYRFDSSIMPARTRRYGMADAPWFPSRIRCPSGGALVEFPPATYRLWRRLPIGGGGYFRLYPSFVVAWAIRRLNRGGVPATIYMHPYEFAPDEIKELIRESTVAAPIPWRLRTWQGWGRRPVARRVDRLLREFRFVRARDLLPESSQWAVWTPVPAPNEQDREATPIVIPTRSHDQVEVLAGAR
jgi:polysaccharide deacetylase family protein (PEP-CTERM system associated)